ncbi:MAG: hypothetical protein ACI8VC_001950 [Candidatus Endobugula sp.]|jgi:hypothetical protein
MQCTPCWLLICQDQSTGYAATCFAHTPEMIIPPLVVGELLDLFLEKSDINETVK